MGSAPSSDQQPHGGGGAHAREAAEGEAEQLAARGITRAVAANPGPLTLTGTNTWVVGSAPAWVIDPGPALEQHVRLVIELVDERGGLGGVALTHRHGDHADAVEALLAARPAPLAAAAGKADVRLAGGERFGPLLAQATPGHSGDHLAFLLGDVCFTGDSVLGAGSVFVAPGEGAMSGYLHALHRLREIASLRVLCPGHGPVVWNAHARLTHYIEHRLERERRLEAALASGRRSEQELLDEVWSDVPAQLRAAAGVTLAAHLQRLQELGRLPEGVERPAALAGEL